MLTSPSELFDKLCQMFPDEEYEVSVNKYHWSIRIGGADNYMCIHNNVQFDGFEIYVVHKDKYVDSVECMGNPRSVWVDDESGWLVIESKVSVGSQHEFTENITNGSSVVKINVMGVLRDD